MRLGRGDVLLCALSRANVRFGMVCAPDLVALQRRGVKIFASESLHAKLYLFGRVAIIGSANVSQRSRELDEAGVVTTNGDIVDRVKSWFEERMQARPVTALHLRDLAAQYRPPTFAPFLERRTTSPGAREAGRQRPANPRTPAESSWWIVWDVTSAARTTPEEDRQEAQVLAKARRSTPRTKPSQLWTLHAGGHDAFVRQVDAGDWIICVRYDAQDRYWVTPANRCRAVQRWRRDRRYSVALALEGQQGSPRVEYSRFANATRRDGVTLQTQTVQIANAAKIRVLERLSSPRAIRALRKKPTR